MNYDLCKTVFKKAHITNLIIIAQKAFTEGQTPGFTTSVLSLITAKGAGNRANLANSRLSSANSIEEISTTPVELSPAGVKHQNSEYTLRFSECTIKAIISDLPSTNKGSYNW